jgi:hypothetical protein
MSYTLLNRGVTSIWLLAITGVAYAPGQATRPVYPDSPREVAAHDWADETRPRLSFFDPAPLTEPLVTDRPDFTESTDAVPRGRYQLEFGYTFTYDREGYDRVRDHTAPELLLRAGLLDDFELRLGWSGYSWFDTLSLGETRGGRAILREDHDQGAADFSLGFKYKVFEQEGLRPHFGVLGGLSMPSGSAKTTAGNVEPELVFAWAYDLHERVGLGGNVGLAVRNDETHQFLQTSASMALGVALTESLGAYVEYFGFYPDAFAQDAAHSLGGGLTFLITDNFQIDLRAGVGLNEQADDLFTGIGMAWRW